MEQSTLDLMHLSYQQALAKSENIIQIVENLYEILNDIEICEADTEEFDAFLEGLRGCIETRKKTFVITNIVTYVNITLMYIVHWLNSTQGMEYDINLTARRKSLESDLRKILEKSVTASNISANIRDRFGLRGVLLNNLSAAASATYIYHLYHAIIGILAGKNRKMKKDFMEWYQNNPHIPPLDKATVEDVLKIPFYVSCVKDYIKNPKDNGYQSLQFTMGIAVYSEILPGCEFEIQLRSQDMHSVAVSGSASHQDYKDDQRFKKVFVVDDFKALNIAGFTSYDSIDDDQDGIHFAKPIVNRRISKTLVP